MSKKTVVSVVIPCHNEAVNIASIFYSISKLFNSLPSCQAEIIFVNDGSTDDTETQIKKIIDENNEVKFVNLSRNFGKEIALAAGLNVANGESVICIDADGQHPVELIPEFITAWQDGYDVVIGVRISNQGEGFIKKYGSKLFYKLFNGLSGTTLVPGSTDFTLIDRQVLEELNKIQENDRILRGLIDWLGFKRTYIEFSAKPRLAGTASYSTRKLIGLAVNSFTSLSLKPLMFIGYLGIAITTISLISGIFIIIQSLLLDDPLDLNISGTAMLAVFITFLIGVLMTAQGLLAVYVSRIYTASRNRPLYIVDKKNSHL